MKKTLILCLLALGAGKARAQFTTIAESPAFQEPGDGNARILQLTNGNTLFIHFTPKQGIQLQLFDRQHHRIDTLPPVTDWKAYKNAQLDAAFESGNGNATIFLSDRSKRHPLLRRLTISAENGLLTEDSVIAEQDKVDLRKKSLASSDFLIIRDPHSGSYAVWMYFNTDDASDAGYQIVHFSANHREISRARFKNFDHSAPFRYWDMAVIGEEKLCILGMEENKGQSGDSLVMKLATLDSGMVFFKFHDLRFPAEDAVTGAFVKYNPQTRQLLLLQAVKKMEKKTERILTRSSVVQLPALNISFAKDIYFRGVNQKQQEAFGSETEYNGVPQNVFFRADGGYSIVFEELDNHIRMMNNTPTVVSTVLANVAVVNYDSTGKEINSWIIPRRHINQGVVMKPFYLKARENVNAPFQWEDQYKLFTYIPGYILINDLDARRKATDPSRQAAIRDISNCHGFYYTLEGEDPVPQRDFVFSTETDRQVALFAFSDYDPVKRTLVTLKRNPDNKREIKLVWLQVPERKTAGHDMAGAASNNMK
ncbi:hypothetical protein [Chitinophaga rhizosphaerae]|uniref:hypothetical protein n=1 Tax=Chitinophaga rhizosphaerae TaxID=1864947 RepID=UPI000F80ABCB|nr:hypothetical protein [Chitinophaga rhizosphaerae]